MNTNRQDRTRYIPALCFRWLTPIYDTVIRIVDFGPPFNRWTALQARLMNGLEHAEDNLHGRLPALLSAAGFDVMAGAEHMNTIFGPIWFHRALKTPT